VKFIKKHPVLVVFLLVFGAYVFWTYFRPVSMNKKIDKQSEHYINDMYLVEGKLYETLSRDAQSLYMTMLKDISKNKIETKFEGPEYNCDVFSSNTENSCAKLVDKVLDAINLDHPELIQWGAYSQMQIGEFQKVDYRYNLKSNGLTVIHTAKMTRMIQDIKNKTKNMDDADKIKYVYEWVSRSEYEYSLSKSSKEQSAFDLFDKKKSTSAGFAKASQIIFQNIGIESYLVMGQTTGNHMWNIIKFKDKYYYFDSTYSASISKDSTNYYSGIGPLAESYLLDYPNLYPSINGDESIIKQ